MEQVVEIIISSVKFSASCPQNALRHLETQSCVKGINTSKAEKVLNNIAISLYYKINVIFFDCGGYMYCNKHINTSGKRLHLCLIVLLFSFDWRRPHMNCVKYTSVTLFISSTCRIMNHSLRSIFVILVPFHRANTNVQAEHNVHSIS